MLMKCEMLLRNSKLIDKTEVCFYHHNNETTDTPKLLPLLKQMHSIFNFRYYEQINYNHTLTSRVLKPTYVENCTQTYNINYFLK